MTTALWITLFTALASAISLWLWVVKGKETVS